jgi:hypothetical protein
MEIHALRSRSRLLPAAAVTLAVAAPLAFASTASACWCPQGMHESAPGSETCTADTPPKTETVTPPAEEQTPAPTTETAAPAPAETPAPPVEQAAAPAPAPAPVAQTPATPAAPAAPAVQSGPTETPVAAEEQPQSEVLGEHAASKPRAVKHTATTKPAAVTAAAPAAAAPEVQTVQAGQLPFTGLDTGLIAMMGAGLLGTGVVLRRRTQPTA